MRVGKNNASHGKSVTAVQLASLPEAVGAEGKFKSMSLRWLAGNMPGAVENS
jgi:hypothetical protein